MFSEEVRKLLAQVISSWQVLAVTVVLVIYVSLVNYTTKLHYRRSRGLPKPTPRKSKAKTSEPVTASESDELGLEEQGQKKK
jgi:energy-converting hydrogenase Eha subunit F